VNASPSPGPSTGKLSWPAGRPKPVRTRRGMRPRASRVSGILAVGLLLGVAATTACNGRDSAEPQLKCPVGGKNAEWSQGEGQLARVVGCGTFRDGRRIDLLWVVSQQPSERCLLIEVASYTGSAECLPTKTPTRGTMTPPVQASYSTAPLRTGPTRLEADVSGIEGTTAFRAEKVVIEFHQGKRAKQTSAQILGVNGRGLEVLGGGTPFSVYVAEVPPDAKRVRATALGPAGEVIGTASAARTGGALIR